MNKVDMLLRDSYKRGMRHYVKELRYCDDFEFRVSPVQCVICKGEAKIEEYLIIGAKEWKPVNQEWENMCKECTDRKELAKVLEQEHANLHDQLAARLHKEYWLVPENLKHAGFKNFIVGDCISLIEAKRIAMDYVRAFEKASPEERHNLLIMGRPGVGKTHLAIAIARILREKGFLVAVLTTDELLEKIKATYRKGASQTAEDILNDIARFDIVILDDLGAEAKSKDEFDWSKNQLFQIISRRLNKPMVYTSNFNEQYLPTAVGARVASRLQANTKFIEIVADDYREKLRIK